MDGTILLGLPQVLTAISEICARHGLKVANIFHAGDGNLHPLILYEANDPQQSLAAEEAGAEILKLCVEVGGCLTGEHGVGIEKRDSCACSSPRPILPCRCASRPCSTPAGCSTQPKCSRSRAARRPFPQPPEGVRPRERDARPAAEWELQGMLADCVERAYPSK